jgi:hypothetical protein
MPGFLNSSANALFLFLYPEKKKTDRPENKRLNKAEKYRFTEHPAARLRWKKKLLFLPYKAVYQNIRVSYK